MLKSEKEILDEIRRTLATSWITRKGRQVPDSESIRLGNDAVEIKGTVLYADLSDSTELVDRYNASFAAEVYKCYLVAACHVLRNNQGVITSFDGDRVMAVFANNSMNTLAAKAALQLNWLVVQVNAALRAQYPNSSYKLSHGIGIDTSDLFVAKTGIRNANDLVWVGRAANYAAKLASINDPGYSVFITQEVFNMLHESSRNGGNPKRQMWERVHWPDKNIPVYRSNWEWSL